MKFLLTALNAKYIHSNPAIYGLRAYAGTELREHIEIAEYTINNYLSDILADIYKKQPDVIAFSCYIWNWNMIQELIVELHKVMPDLPIWLGGPEVSFDAQEIVDTYSMVTGIMIGEGEVTFKELLEHYVAGKKDQDLEKIAGLCLRAGFTPIRELTDLSGLPFLYEDLDEFANKIIYYESSRGCPYRCSYCLSSIDKTVRLRDINIVKKELQFFLDNKVPQVKFVDRTFNCNHQHAMEVWQYILENDNGVTNFHFEISADILNEAEISLLHQMRPGLVQLEIGVQSTNPDTLQAINRTMSVEKLERIVASIYGGNNIHQHLDLIAGLPFEDYDSFGRSFNRVYAMKPEQLQLGFLKVLKGSEMHQRAQEFGIVYLEKPPYEVLFTKWLPYNQVLQLKKIEEMVELYYNSNQFTHTIGFLEQTFSSPFAMFEAMADFYEKKGFFVTHPARAYRYHILLDFAETYDSINREIYCELLTYDMYLRENLKSRPDFAVDLIPYKEKIRAFYKEEESNRTYLSTYAQYDYKQMSKMTHLEIFHYPVWDSSKMAPYLIQADSTVEYFILFDYQARNPLNYEAKTIVIEEGLG